MFWKIFLFHHITTEFAYVLHESLQEIGRSGHVWGLESGSPSEHVNFILRAPRPERLSLQISISPKEFLQFGRQPFHRFCAGFLCWTPLHLEPHSSLRSLFGAEFSEKKRSQWHTTSLQINRHKKGQCVRGVFAERDGRASRRMQTDRSGDHEWMRPHSLSRLLSLICLAALTLTVVFFVSHHSLTALTMYKIAISIYFSIYPRLLLCGWSTIR